MKAILFDGGSPKLALSEVARPTPSRGEILIRVRACAVCRTDLHIVDGDLTPPVLPIVPGHEIVGQVAARGPGAERFEIGQRVGVPWLGQSCGRCALCRSERENLCDDARFTGFHRDGGFAEYAVANEAFCFALPESYSDAEAAPLMCAGLIGYRALSMAGEARRIGLYGFGAAAHIVAQVARHQGREVFALTRPGDAKTQAFARDLGAVWAGGSDEIPPKPLDAALIFAPVGPLVPQALRALAKGGAVVCAGIHMSDIPSFPYEILWQERQIRSVANLTRKDGDAFLAIAPKAGVRVETHLYPLERANAALDDLRAGRFDGAAVLTMGDSYSALG